MFRLSISKGCAFAFMNEVDKITKRYVFDNFICKDKTVFTFFDEELYAEIYMLAGSVTEKYYCK